MRKEYCWFGSDNFNCDVHVYQHGEKKYIVEVASVRWGYDILTNHSSIEDVEWEKERNVLVPIGLPYDGMIYAHPDLALVNRQLIELRTLGYRVPSTVIAKISEEIWGTFVIGGTWRPVGKVISLERKELEKIHETMRIALHSSSHACEEIIVCLDDSDADNKVDNP